MVFQIHHAKGTLTVSAPGRDSAIKWAERQLGHLTQHFSVTQLQVKDGIEKTGTGIRVMDITWNHPVYEVEIDLVGHSYGREGHNCQENIHFSSRMVAQAPTWH